MATSDDYPQAEADFDAQAVLAGVSPPSSNSVASGSSVAPAAGAYVATAGGPGSVASANEGQLAPMDAANPESIEDAELAELIHMLNRNWSMIAFYTVLGGSIGFSLYLFTGFLELCWIMVMGCFVIACIVDVIWGSRVPQLKLLSIDDIQDDDTVMQSPFNEGRDDECRFYIRSDFVHYWFDVLHMKFRQYYLGTTTISVVGQAMTVRFKGVDRVFGYRGYEIGVVIGFLLSNIIWVEFVLKTELQGSTSSTAILKTCMYFWLWALFSIVCAVTEREVRSRRFIPPTALATDLLEVIRIDEISAYEMERLSWSLVEPRMRPSNPRPILVFQRAFYFLYQILMGVVFLIIFLIRSLFSIFWYNALFALFLIDTIACGFLFYAHLWKVSDFHILVALVFCFIGFFLSVYGIYWYQKQFSACSIGKKTVPQLDDNRLERRDRLAFLAICVLAGILFVVSAALLATATQNLGLVQWKAAEWKLPKTRDGRTMLEHLTCQDPKKRRRLPSTFPNQSGVYKLMCEDKVYLPLSTAGWLLGINWWMLLIAAFVSQLKDPLSTKPSPVNRREWTTYTWVVLRSVKRWTFGAQSFLTWLSSYWGVHPGFPIAIPLGNEDAEQLEEFLQANCAVYQGGRK